MIKLIMEYFHLVSAIVWVGGLFFIAIVEVPVLRRELKPLEFSRLMERTGKRFQVIGWLMMLILLITGVVNIMIRGESDAGYSDIYANSMIVKVFLFLLIIVNTALHTFYLGPRMATLSNRIDSGTPELNKEHMQLKRRSAMSSAVNLILSLVIVAFGILTSSG